jgi:uracil-DNA glycosylase
VQWCEQGVLLLNAALTVRASEANSHANKGWEAFTGAAIAALSARRSGVVFLLWGKHAQDRGKGVDKKKHHVLVAPHPSGLSAHRVREGGVGEEGRGCLVDGCKGS